MKDYKYIFGPIPSRRLGLSIGVSTIPKKYCNYSCIYCQLGRTNHLTNTRENFFPLDEILKEFEEYLKDLNDNNKFDVISLVGEGEPTLYSDLNDLILGLKKFTSKPIVVITNGGLLNDKDVQNALLNADIVMPSINYFDEESFRKIHRPHGKIKYEDTYNALVEFSKIYKGELWLEVMLLENINDDKDSILKIKKLIDNVNHSRVYVNTAVRPPAESYVKPCSKETLEFAEKTLGGTSIENLISKGFFSEIEDNYEAILSIIKRHPMNEFEIKSFLESRNCSEEEIEKILNSLKKEVSFYKGFFRN